MTTAELRARLRIPAVVAPMFLVSDPALTIAACKAGLVGSFPSLNARTELIFEEWLQRIERELSNCLEAAPYAVNIIVQDIASPRFATDLALVERYKPPIVITSVGQPGEVVERVHAYGGLIFHDVSTPRHAQKAIEQDVDGLILLTAGAGGRCPTPKSMGQRLRKKDFRTAIFVYSWPLNIFIARERDRRGALMLVFPEFQPHFARNDWTLGAVLEKQAAEREDSPFLSWCEGRPLTFGEVNALANRLGRGFQAQGVAKGGMVGILLPNCPEFVLLWFGLCKIGAVEVAISDAYKGDFLAHPLRLSRTRILVTTAELAARVAEIQNDLPDLEKIFLVDVDGGAAAAPHFDRIEVARYDDLLADDASNPGVVVHPSDPGAVLMTSGTTGPSKGVLMPHSQLYFFAEEDVQLMRLTADDVYMTGFPLFHGNAQFLTVYPCLIVGAQVALYPRFSASDWAGRAHRSGATVTNLLGATMAFILAHPARAEDRAHCVRTIYAAPLAADLGRQFTERFGISDFVDGFGQTEISNVFMTPPGAERPDGASGVLVDQWFEARLVDSETGVEVPEGQSGELWIRPKVPGIICAEYLGMPEKTVEAWRDLWFHTGDGLRRDAEGWYYFVDRVKDALRRRGENISSFEVESGVRSHPAVAECAVVGVRADQAGGEDEILAFVVPVPGETIEPQALADWCEARMPGFMVPRYVEFIDALPLTASEKVRKKELRERGIGPATWDRETARIAAKVAS